MDVSGCWYFEQDPALVTGRVAAAAARLKALKVILLAWVLGLPQEQALADVLKDGEVGAGGELAQLEGPLVGIHRGGGEEGDFF